MTRPIYTLQVDPTPPTYHTGTRHRVFRDGVEVASIYEDPSLTGGGLSYEGAVAFVSMNTVRWAGVLPDGPDAWLGFDFVSPNVRADDVIDEVIDHVERLLAWRKTKTPQSA